MGDSILVSFFVCVYINDKPVICQLNADVVAVFCAQSVVHFVVSREARTSRSSCPPSRLGLDRAKRLKVVESFSEHSRNVRKIHHVHRSTSCCFSRKRKGKPKEMKSSPMEAPSPEWHQMVERLRRRSRQTKRRDA